MLGGGKGGRGGDRGERESGTGPERGSSKHTGHSSLPHLGRAMKCVLDAVLAVEGGKGERSHVSLRCPN